MGSPISNRQRVACDISGEKHTDTRGRAGRCAERGGEGDEGPAGGRLIVNRDGCVAVQWLDSFFERNLDFNSKLSHIRI
jgi:hypothetical protein